MGTTLIRTQRKMACKLGLLGSTLDMRTAWPSSTMATSATFFTWASMNSAVPMGVPAKITPSVMTA